MRLGLAADDAQRSALAPLVIVAAASVLSVVLWAVLAALVGASLGLALSLGRARRLLSSPERVRQLNLVSGVLLIGVGCVIPFT